MILQSYIKWYNFAPCQAITIILLGVYICYLRYANITHVPSTAVPFSVFRNFTVFSVAFGGAVFTDG